MTRTGGPHYWQRGKPNGWQIIMGDLRQSATPEAARSLVEREYEYEALFVDMLVDMLVDLFVDMF